MLPGIGQFLFVVVETKDGEELYKSKVADVSRDTIAMEVPLHEKTGKPMRLFTGDALQMYFVTEGGVKNFFHTVVTGFSEDTIPLVWIEKPSPHRIQKVQRRNFLRVPAELELAVNVDGMRFVALTEDLSGGGLAFLCEQSVSLNPDQIISCWLLLQFRNGQIEHVPFQATVVRTKKMETGKQLVMVQFKDMPEADQQKIVRYCFERQLDFRKA